MNGNEINDIIHLIVFVERYSPADFGSKNSLSLTILSHQGELNPNPDHNPSYCQLPRLCHGM
jgi:hypothetical protein